MALAAQAFTAPGILDDELRPAGTGLNRYSLLFDESRRLQDALSARIERKLRGQIPKQARKTTYDAIRKVLYNAYRAYRKNLDYPDCQIVVKYSRRREHYKSLEQYSLKLRCYKAMMRAIELLDGLGLIVSQPSRPGSDYLSMYWPTKELNDLFEDHLESLTIKIVNKARVILKDEQKQLMGYKVTKAIKKLIDQVNRFLKEVHKHDFSLVLPVFRLIQLSERAQRKCRDLGAMIFLDLTLPDLMLPDDPSTLLMSSIDPTVDDHHQIPGHPDTDQTSHTHTDQDHHHHHINTPYHQYWESLKGESYRYPQESQGVICGQPWSKNEQIIDLAGKLDWHRAFCRGSFDKGGRYYAEIQSIHKELRPFLSLDGHETCELDYSGIHIRMLYAQEGLECPEDPYKADSGRLEASEGLRGAFKVAMMCLINARNKRSATGAINKAIRNGEISVPKGVKAKDLVGALENLHDPIKKHFFSDSGVSLQHTDSTIAERVIDQFIGLGKPILPLHDGFCVMADDRGLLLRAMREAYAAVVAYEPVIKDERSGALCA